MKHNFVQFRNLKPELVTTWTDGRLTIAQQLESARCRRTRPLPKRITALGGFYVINSELTVVVSRAASLLGQEILAASRASSLRLRPAPIGESIGRRPHPGGPS
jgi:hypothetical protein